MSEAKYNALKNAIIELSEVYGGDASMQVLNEIMSVVDKTTDEKKSENEEEVKTRISKEDILQEKDSHTRIKLISENMELFQGGK